MKKKTAKRAITIPKETLDSFETITQLLNEYWPGVHGVIGKDGDCWTVVAVPGVVERIGRNETEMREYLSTHPRTEQGCEDEFLAQLKLMMGL